MTRPTIMLAEKEIPLGVKVYAYQSGHDTPLRISGTEVPYTLIALKGDPPIKGRGLYRVDGNGDVNIDLRLRGFSDGTKFSPVIVHTIQDAPAEQTYFAFVNGAMATHDLRYLHDYTVLKSDDGKFYRACDLPLHYVAYHHRRVQREKLERSEELDEISDALCLTYYNRWGRSKKPESYSMQFELVALLSKKHGFSYNELIPLFQQVNGILVETQLPANAELVPEEGLRSTYDFEKQMVKATA